ncbi:hypothetical protein MKX08_000187 [Trichoderma sp. CBMAI-0020]|nr:hypothetical protein MKX08_000187 [Trichoderma sp. CBMAI-0020]
MDDAHDTDIKGQEILFSNGGWDAHHHIFEPSRFPYSLDRHLTPPAASVKQYEEWKSDLGLTQRSRNSWHSSQCLQVQRHARRRTPKSGTEGACRSTETPLSWLEHDFHPHTSGILGRINASRGGNRCKRYLIITDHFALLKAPSTLPEEYKGDITLQPGFTDIVLLVRSGALYVKINAPYRISNLAPDYTDVRPLITALVEANPQQILWGSDWPHTPRMKVRSREEALRETPYLKVDDRAWLRQLKSWLTEEQWDLIMVKNPQRFYGG